MRLSGSGSSAVSFVGCCGYHSFHESSWRDEMQTWTLGEIRQWCEANGVALVDAVKVLEMVDV